jgi:putative endonuclease
MNRRQRLGKWGEKAARQYLLGQGYRILGENVRTPYGEIDLIAQHAADPELVVFVEVKTRTSSALGWPEEGVTPQKEAHLLAASAHYAAAHGIDHWQVDVIAILGRPEKYQLRHWENALRDGR